MEYPPMTADYENEWNVLCEPWQRKYSQARQDLRNAQLFIDRYNRYEENLSNSKFKKWLKDEFGSKDKGKSFFEQTKTDAILFKLRMDGNKIHVDKCAEFYDAVIKPREEKAAANDIRLDTEEKTKVSRVEPYIVGVIILGIVIIYFILKKKK